MATHDQTNALLVDKKTVKMTTANGEQYDITIIGDVILVLPSKGAKRIAIIPNSDRSVIVKQVNE